MSSVPSVAMSLLFALWLTLPGFADDASLKQEAIRGRSELARAATADGLIEESIREWQLVKRDDPANEEAAKALASAAKPWILAWDSARHRKWVAWSEKRRAFTGDLARRWANLAEQRDKAGDRDGCWEACQRAFACDADCQRAHELLGEAKHDGVWVTEEVAAKRSKGLLELRGEWLSAADVRKRRMEWAEAWEMHGSHFTVRSNRGLGPGRSVLALAERVHAAFMREIMGVVDAPPVTKRLQVLDFSTLEDLDAHIKAEHQGGTTPKGVPGFYSPGEGVHLAVLPEGSALTRDEVVLHECCHAAAGRAIPLTGWINSRANFWAWEGLASYFESTESRDGKIVTGNPSIIRLKLAHDELADGKFTPLARFVVLDQEGLGKQYQQAAGLVHFFLHWSGGKYRETFIRYFKVVATGVSDEKTFEKEFGRGAGTFEAEWRQHVMGLK
ncbi:MAG: hypothetical protein FD180_623 [Planctomycetota bacterium]|nr:MAG: hypothetical protein FD180_623 [Planctomycetota bacterium]